MKAQTIPRLKQIADQYHSLATRYRFAYERGGELYCNCVTCGAPKPLKIIHCGHFMSRRYAGTRYDEQNTAPQCANCNTFNQGQQYRFSLWIDDFYGNGTARHLEQKAQLVHKLTKDELLDIIADRKLQIAEYQQSY